MTSILRKTLLPSILVILAYGFWISPDFKAISAGVAIFLFGMLALEEGFKAFTGGILEKILRRTTNKLWKSLSFGVVSTTLMQSSSLVSVITISFLSAGLLGLYEGIGIIFGANLGTTTGAWLIAGFGLKVKIAAYAMPMLVFGVILIFQDSKHLKGIGYIFAGLGFLFLGIHYMKEGFETFKATIDLAEYAVAGYPGLLLFALIGVFATVVMQSSHATLVLIITALAAGQITYENALALAIGANVGTTITAILGSLSSNEQGKRLAGAHLIFNVTTGLIAIGFIHQFLVAVDYVSAMVGIADNDYTLKLAVFHTLFNLTGIVVMIPFIGRLVLLLEKVVRAEPIKFAKPKYLNESTMEFLDTAVESVRLETIHIYEKSRSLIAGGLSLHKSDFEPGQNLDDLIAKRSKKIDFDFDNAYERNVKILNAAVIDFLGKVKWEPEYADRRQGLREANRNILTALKGIKHLQKNMLTNLGSDNEYVRAEYNRMRRQIASIVQQLEEIRLDPENDVTILSLDAIRLEVVENDQELDARIERLIRKGRVSPQMGVSLINDNTYSFEISEHLIDMGAALFGRGEKEETDAERLIALSDDELDEFLKGQE